ncbi:MAG: M1 family metallopeptidase [Thermoanaerobaculia bacterium]
MSPKPFLFVLALFLTGAVHAAPVADPTYTELRKARPDGRRVPIQGLTLDRDVFHFQFESGAFHFLAPVEGRTVGAVFVGKGSLKLVPATPAETRQLALASGGDKSFESLTEEFDELVLLFADDTAAEIQLHAPVQTGAPDPKAVQAWEAHLKRQRKEFKTNFHIRVLQDLLNTPGLTSGVFLAFMDGKRYPPALAAVDPYGVEALRLAIRLGGEDSVFFVADENRGGVWYLCDQKGEVERKRSMPEKRLTEALDYKVETSVAKDADVSGTTTIRFQPLVAGLRVLPIHLLPKLRLSEAVYALDGTEPAWKPAAIIQEDDEEDGDAAVVFPEAPAKGATVLLRLTYKGDEVLEDAGEKNFYVGARESWYPNLGVFSDPATFELIYKIPLGNEVVSVGRQTESRTEGKQIVSVWKTGHPVQVAGFNYGKFKKVEQTDETSGLQVEVYTNPGTPDLIREINAALSGGGEEGGGPTLGTMNTSRLAESALVDGINSARLFTTYFGPLEARHVAITQQSDWAFGQSWPSLIFLPYLAFMTGTQRTQVLGFGGPGLSDFVEEVGYHEFAHQWWGHLVGAATFHDQWLEEGFSEFSAALAVQHVKGWAEYDRFWRERKKQILGKDPGNAVANYDAGPITQGLRLFTQRSPSAYPAVVYAKGGYVIHMLRMMMWDGSSQIPDARFIAMMQDFTKTYGGKVATTADFQRVVEKHMTPNMNATGDGKMDWFFNQWVYGTEVPRYKQDLKITPGEGGKYRISGSITQEGVSKGFRALVPIYVEFSKTESARVGVLPFVGEATVPVDVQIALPKKPKRALINARGEVLARE